MDLATAVKELREEGYIEGELSIHPLWYRIWKPEDREQYNRDYELAKYLPGFTAFGSNGGGELFVADESGSVYSVPAIGMEPQFADKIAASISDLKQFMIKNPQ